jgi:hypothetical protein
LRIIDREDRAPSSRSATLALRAPPHRAEDLPEMPLPVVAPGG